MKVIVRQEYFFSGNDFKLMKALQAGLLKLFHHCWVVYEAERAGRDDLTSSDEVNQLNLLHTEPVASILLYNLTCFHVWQTTVSHITINVYMCVN